MDMKKFLTLLAAGALTAGVWADIDVPVVTNDGSAIDPGYKYEVTGLPTGYSLNNTTVFYDAAGNKVSGTSHALVDFSDNKLSYFDLARIANGYRLGLKKDNATATQTSTTLATYDNGYVVHHWGANNEGSINVTDLLKSGNVTVKGGDIIMVYCDNQDRHAQLYYTGQSGEWKYGNSANSSCNSGWGSGADGAAQDAQLVNNDGTNYYFDFVITDAAATTINWCSQQTDQNIYFKAQDDGFTVTSIVLLSTEEEADDATGKQVTITKTDTKIPSFASMSIPTQTVSVTYEPEATLVSDLSVEINNWDSNFNLASYDAVKNTTFAEGDILQVYVEANVTGQLHWNDGDEIKYAYSMTSGNNYNDGYGTDASTAIGSVAPLEWATEYESGKYYYDFYLTAAMASAMNSRLADSKNINVCSGSWNKVLKVTVKKCNRTVTTIDSSNNEYRVYNLWNAKEDEYVEDHGFDAMIWGFTDDSTDHGFNKFNTWCDADGNDRYNIKAVEAYFEGDEGQYWKNQGEWADAENVLSPEYWAAVAPRFDAKIGDKVIVAIEPYYNQDDWGKSNCLMQMWNVIKKESTDNGVTTTTYESNILTWSGSEVIDDGHNIKIYESSRYNSGEMIWTFNLDSQEMVDLARRGFRLKGRGYKVHRIDLISLAEKQKETATDVFYIKVTPEALKAHKGWNLANRTDMRFRPSQSESLNHWGESAGEDDHNFPTSIDLFYYVDNTTARDKVTTEFFAYNPDGSAYPIDQFITTKDASCNVRGKDLGYNNYAPGTPSHVSQCESSRLAFSVNIAGMELYSCECDEFESGDTHYAPKYWYKPLDEMVAALEAHGIYVKVTVEKEVTSSQSAPRRAPKYATSSTDPSGLTFTKSTAQDDEKITYALATDQTEPEVYFHRASLAASDKIIYTGVDELAAEQGNVEVYNLQGYKVAASDLTPGVYVVRKNGQACKVVIK